MRVRQEVYDKNGNMDEKLLCELDTFIHDWLTDIAQQDYELSPERQIENDVPFFDEQDMDTDYVFEDESVEVSCGVEI